MVTASITNTVKGAPSMKHAHANADHGHFGKAT
jgi:hypothetical protein